MILWDRQKIVKQEELREFSRVVYYVIFANRI